MKKLPKIIAVLGPTASGKTSLGILLAKKFNGEVISVDSRQVYRGMDIGTAKEKGEWVKEKLMVENIAHWGIDLVDPDQKFNAFDFKQFAEEKIANIIGRGKVPILVGGTGLYAQALIDNFNFEQEKGSVKYNALQICLSMPREKLYERINKRVDEMIDEGLVDEVRGLKEKYGCAIDAMTGIGYRQICRFLDEKAKLDDAIIEIKKDSRHYAKRQLTWFKRDDRIQWITDSNEAVKLVKDFL